MTQSLKELIQYRELLWAFTIRNIKIKYKQTFMGFLWAIFMPLVIVLSGVVVKFAMAHLSGKKLEMLAVSSVMVKSLPWAFFIGALKFSVGSLVANMNILKKIYFPRVIFPLSYTLGQIFDLAIATVAFALFLTLAKIGVSIHLLWLPVLLILLIMLTAGIGMLFSCANAFYRDVKYIIDVALTFAIFFTPVFFSADMFGKWGVLFYVNPVGSILECIEITVIHHQAPPYLWLAYAAAWSIGSFFIGWNIFHKVEPVLADSI